MLNELLKLLPVTVMVVPSEPEVGEMEMMEGVPTGVVAAEVPKSVLKRLKDEGEAWREDPFIYTNDCCATPITIARANTLSAETTSHLGFIERNVLFS